MAAQNADRPPVSGFLDTSRLIGLTDGLFATVLTLLVLELRIPEIADQAVQSTEAQFFQHIVALSPRLLSYILTFLVSGLYWQAHHRMFETTPHADRRLLSFNLMFLLCTGLLPFSTEVVGARGDRIAWSIYCINIILVGVMFALEWQYAYSHQLMQENLSKNWAKAQVTRSFITPAVFLLGLILAQVNLRIAFFTPVLIPIIRITVEQRLKMEPGQHIPGQSGQGQNRLGRDLFWRVVVYFPLYVFFIWFFWAISYLQTH